MGRATTCGRFLGSACVVCVVTPINMAPGVGDRCVEIVKDVALGIEVSKHPCCGQDSSVLGPCALDEDSDFASVQLVDDLGEGVGAGRVDESQPSQPEDDHLDPLHLPELFEEAGSRSKKQGAIQSEDGDVIGEQRRSVDGSVVMLCKVFLGGSGTGGNRPQCEDPGNHQADLDGGHQVHRDSDHGRQDEDHCL